MPGSYSVAAAINAFYPLPSTGGLSDNLAGCHAVTASCKTTNSSGSTIKLTSNNHLMALIPASQRAHHICGRGSVRPRALRGSLAENLHEDTLQDDWTITPHIVNHFALGDIGFLTSQTNNPLGDPKYYVPVPGSFGAGFPGSASKPRTITPRQRPRQLHHWRGELRGGPDPRYSGYGLLEQGCAQHQGRRSGTCCSQAQAATNSGRNGYYNFSGAETAQVSTASRKLNHRQLLRQLPAGPGRIVRTWRRSIHPILTSRLSAFTPRTNGGRPRISAQLRAALGYRASGIYESQNRFAAMNPTTPNPGAGDLPGAYTFAPQLHVRNFTPTYYGAWSPRFGAAYSVKPDLIVRASFGVLRGPTHRWAYYRLHGLQRFQDRVIFQRRRYAGNDLGRGLDERRQASQF